MGPEKPGQGKGSSREALGKSSQGDRREAGRSAEANEQPGRSCCRISEQGGAAVVIYELLAEGAENAKTGREICRQLHIDMRGLTATIEQERRAGYPICASTGANPGYFLAANKEEMLQYCAALAHRADEITKTRQACAKTVKHLPGGAIIGTN